MNPEELGDLPGILIPCENIAVLKELIRELYSDGVITENSFKIVNVPKDNDFLDDIF